MRREVVDLLTALHVKSLLYFLIQQILYICILKGLSWSNKREGRRHTELLLDWVIHNASWLSLWPLSHCKTPYRIFSNHYPILLSFGLFVRKIARPFRFSNCWVEHSDFDKEVWSSWYEPIGYVSNPMQSMMIKLQRLKRMLKQWNWQVFGNVDQNVLMAEEELEVIQTLGVSDERCTREQAATSKFSHTLHV